MILLGHAVRSACEPIQTPRLKKPMSDLLRRGRRLTDNSHASRLVGGILYRAAGFLVRPRRLFVAPDLPLPSRFCDLRLDKVFEDRSFGRVLRF
jgi:hypothetical protein